MFDRQREPAEYKQDAYVFRQWLLSAASDNSQELNQAKKNIAKAMRHLLTEKQLLYATMYYVEGKNIPRIESELGVDRSTISRTLGRARKRLKMVLMYSGPLLLKATVDGWEEERNG